MRHEPYRPSLHLETLACEGHAIVVKGSQRGLFHCTYIMSTVQLPPAPQRSARMNIVIRHTPQQYLVDGFRDEETACALQHHYIAAQRTRPRVVLDPPCQYFVEELRAQRREIHATFEAVPYAQSACEHATCTGNILAAEALLAEIIGHALRRDPPQTFRQGGEIAAELAHHQREPIAGECAAAQFAPMARRGDHGE